MGSGRGCGSAFVVACGLGFPERVRQVVSPSWLLTCRELLLERACIGACTAPPSRLRACCCLPCWPIPRNSPFSGSIPWPLSHVCLNSLGPLPELSPVRYAPLYVAYGTHCWFRYSPRTAGSWSIRCTEARHRDLGTGRTRDGSEGWSMEGLQSSKARTGSRSIAGRARSQAPPSYSRAS